MNSLHLKLNTSSDTNNQLKNQDQHPTQNLIPSKTEQPLPETTQNDQLKTANQKEEISNLKNLQTTTNTFPALINYLISPIKDLRYKESAFTPLKNENNYFSFSPSKIFEMKTESPFERLEQSSGKNKFQYPSINNNIHQFIQGKKINFNDNNIQIIKNNNNVNTLNEKFTSLNIPLISNQNNTNKYICTCTKTNCKKKYCACYANGRYCDGCQCENCQNKCPININNNLSYDVDNGINNGIANGNNTICNCTKSGCKKKYCECYKVGKKCSWLCRCVGCSNCLSPIAKCEEFEVEGFGIEIKENIIYFLKRNVNLNEEVNKEGKCDGNLEIENKEMLTPMKVTNKKRQRVETITTTIGQISTNQKTAMSKVISDEGLTNKRITRKKLKI